MWTIGSTVTRSVVAGNATPVLFSRAYSSTAARYAAKTLWAKQTALVKGGVTAAGLVTGGAGGAVLVSTATGITTSSFDMIGGSSLLSILASTTTNAEGSQQQKQQQEEPRSIAEILGSFFGGGSGKDSKDDTTTTTSSTATSTETCHSGPGQRVLVDLDPQVVDALPVMTLEEVRKCNGLDNKRGDDRLLVTYEGIVYDVTQFFYDHPGGSDLIATAAGMDLDHFFANYTVHGKTAKAAQWLAPLAVGKLSDEEALVARDTTTAQSHVDRRGRLLQRSHRKMMVVAATLPFWMTLRGMISWIGWVVPPLGRLLAWALPVTVPGFSPGAEPLPLPADEQQSQDDQSVGTIAVIGGGIAGCGAAWALTQSGLKVTLFEAREQISGNARTFDWDFSPFRGKGATVKSCVSVTAWPPLFYKNYTLLLEHLNIPTVPMPLSWVLNSKVPGYEGTLWEADPAAPEGSLRRVFAKDFDRYHRVLQFSRAVTNFFTLRWAPWRWNDAVSMYDTHQGLGLLNPLTMVPLYSLFKMIGGSEAWWNIVFTPQYTASFLVDELRPFPAVFGPLIEDQIPLLPNKSNTWQGSSSRSENDCNITTCVTWKDAGKGIRKTFELMMQGVDLRENTRVRRVEVLDNGKKRVYDEFDNYVDVDRVVFACAANAVGNIHQEHRKIPFANTILSSPIYADDHHPSSGHMHAVMHSDGSVIPKELRSDALKRASNYVEITQTKDGSLNIENQYNFGVQTPGPGVYDLPLDQKPVMLISHALGEGKSIDPSLVRGQGNHVRAHPLYSGWNVAAQLSLRLVQGRDGIYYCSNWTTPGNCHDMSFLSGLICAHAIGAKYPFSYHREANKDFHRLRDLMGF